VNREAELTRPSRVACSDLLGGTIINNPAHQSSHLKESAQENKKIGESEQHHILPELPNRLRDAGPRITKRQDEAAADERDQKNAVHIDILRSDVTSSS